MHPSDQSYSKQSEVSELIFQDIQELSSQVTLGNGFQQLEISNSDAYLTSEELLSVNCDGGYGSSLSCTWMCYTALPATFSDSLHYTLKMIQYKVSSAGF